MILKINIIYLSLKTKFFKILLNLIEFVFNIRWFLFLQCEFYKYLINLFLYLRILNINKLKFGLERIKYISFFINILNLLLYTLELSSLRNHNLSIAFKLITHLLLFFLLLFNFNLQKIIVLELFIEKFCDQITHLCLIIIYLLFNIFIFMFLFN